jgi:RHH-type proline utilization regulon transcriptional repressor/proline dehydrogenase/delta 1-pyrroline-5-carboxylate dehydrogenase
LDLIGIFAIEIKLISKRGHDAIRSSRRRPEQPPWPAPPARLFDAPYAEDDERDRRAAAAGGRPGAGRPRPGSTPAPPADRGDPHAKVGGLGGIEELLREYSLSTKEGLALMVLAEALLRVPDAATADRLIEDKLGQGDFAHHETKSDAFLVSASAWALGVTARVIQPGETPTRASSAGLVQALGLPAVRAATRQAMRLMGTISCSADDRGGAEARPLGRRKGYRYSFDMLGEGARTAADAERYFASYADAIEAIGKAAGNDPCPNRPGISVKLSALHPRYEAVQRARARRAGAAR